MLRSVDACLRKRPWRLSSPRSMLGSGGDADGARQELDLVAQLLDRVLPADRQLLQHPRQIGVDVANMVAGRLVDAAAAAVAAIGKLGQDRPERVLGLRQPREQG